nr:MAG TPA: hypothetical protein [Inoviridae sp.]
MPSRQTGGLILDFRVQKERFKSLVSRSGILAQRRRFALQFELKFDMIVRNLY